MRYLVVDTSHNMDHILLCISGEILNLMITRCPQNFPFSQQAIIAHLVFGWKYVPYVAQSVFGTKYFTNLI